MVSIEKIHLILIVLVLDVHVFLLSYYIFWGLTEVMAHSWVSQLILFSGWKKRNTLEGKNGEIPKMVTSLQEITSILLRKINIWQEFGGWECVFVSLNASGAIIKVYASLLGNTKQRNPKQLTLEILPSVIMKNKWGTVTVIESRGTQRRTLINTTKKVRQEGSNCVLFLS